jgi:hypothetical protein
MDIDYERSWLNALEQLKRVEKYEGMYEETKADLEERKKSYWNAMAKLHACAMALMEIERICHRANNYGVDMGDIEAIQAAIRKANSINDL